MSDEIRDKERARAEQVAQAKQAEQKARLGKEGDFRKMITKLQQGAVAANKQQTQQGQQRDAQASRLMARSGIVARDFSSKLQSQGDARNVAGRGKRASDDASMATKRQALQRATPNAARPAAQPQQQKGHGGTPQRRGSEERSTQKEKGSGGRSVDQLLAAHSGIVTPNAILGVQTAQTSASGASGAPTIQQMIDQIVKSVRQGFDPKGLGMIEIDLNDDVLAGAHLQLTTTAAGLDLKIFSDDADASRLLSAGATANELSRTLSGHKIKLNSLEVNRHRVLG